MPGPFFRLAATIFPNNFSETFAEFNATVLPNLNLYSNNSTNSTTDAAENEGIRNIWILGLTIATIAGIMLCQYSRHSDRRDRGLRL